MGRFVSATGPFLLATNGQFPRPPTSSYRCPLTVGAENGPRGRRRRCTQPLQGTGGYGRRAHGLRVSASPGWCSIRLWSTPRRARVPSWAGYTSMWTTFSRPISGSGMLIDDLAGASLHHRAPNAQAFDANSGFTCATTRELREPVRRTEGLWCGCRRHMVSFGDRWRRSPPAIVPGLTCRPLAIGWKCLRWIVAA